MTEKYKVFVDAVAHVQAGSKEQAKRKAMEYNWESLDITRTWFDNE